MGKMNWKKLNNNRQMARYGVSANDKGTRRIPVPQAVIDAYNAERGVAPKGTIEERQRLEPIIPKPKPLDTHITTTNTKENQHGSTN